MTTPRTLSNPPLLLRKLLGDGTRPQPLLATPGLARTALGVVSAKYPALGLRPDAAAPVLAWWDDDDEPAAGLAADKEFRVVGGIAVIPVAGMLVNKTGSLHPYCGMTGYDGLRELVGLAERDPDVRGILLDVESGGGEVDGCFDLVDYLWSVRQRIPLWSACTARAYSAAYAIASQGERVWVPAVGGTGSVGVVCMHVDVSRLWDKEGVTVTLVHAGEHKVDGHPYAALPPEVRAEWEAEMEAMRRQFADRVARGRGLTAEAVLATEARCFEAEESLAVGFATDRGTIHDALAAFAAHLDGATGAVVPPTLESTMKTQQQPAKAGAAAKPRAEGDQPKDDEEDKDAPAAEDEEKDDEEDKDAPAAKVAAASGGKAATAERQRIAAIMGSPEAKGRQKLAEKLAFETDMAPAAAEAILMAAPREASAPAQGAAAFAAAMQAGAPNPALGVGGGDHQPQASGLRAACEAEVSRMTATAKPRG